MIVDSIYEVIVQLLVCNAVNKTDYSRFNAIASLLRADKNFIVGSKANFTSSPDAGSPYYFSAPMIKYSDPALKPQALQVQEAIKKASGYTLALQLQRSNLKNYISAYLCSAESELKPGKKQLKMPVRTKQN
ncbi:MAG: hypothetical protein EOO03_02510 [Chitinophagaceae bacterium]|nr:MAG: hypothetical protein EOO03_02510 [Chitinophagaceae bacterium]